MLFLLTVMNTRVSSKTDQYREGSSLVIDCTGTPTYLVAMMEKYFSMGGLCTQEHGKVFWAKVGSDCVNQGGGGD